MPYRSNQNEDEGDLETGTRVCTKCARRQPMGEFYWASTGKHRIRTCRTCASESAKQRHSANPEQRRQYGFVRNLRVKYGLALDQYQLLLERQGGVCAICHAPLKERHIQVDHNHATGLVRGLLCSDCNLAIGLLHESIESIERCIGYLQSEPPQLDYRSRGLSPEERKRKRSEATTKWFESEDARRAIRNRSSQPQLRGSSADLTEEQAIEIVRKYRTGKFTQYTLAAEYGIIQSYVARLMCDGTRFHIEAKTKEVIDEETTDA
jgi:hypothetical protein